MSDLSSVNMSLIFGTDTGNTEEIAGKISAAIEHGGGDIEMIEVTEASPEVMELYDLIIMGIPTWDFGGIQSDWERFETQLREADLSNKVVALYGLGDQFGYADYFVDAMGWLHDIVQDTGATIIGVTSTEGYEFTESRAANEDNSQFCGLAIDEDQQFELTDDRIANWVAQITQQYAEQKAA